MARHATIMAVLALLPLAAARGGEPGAADLEKRVAALEEAKADGSLFLKFGIVSESEVLDNLEEKKDVDVDIELLEQQAREVLLGMQKECQDLEKEIDLLAAGSEERDKKSKLLDKKKRELAAKYQDLSGDVQQQAARKRDEIRVRIRSTIAQYARKEGYSLVIEKTALLFGEEGKSLSNEIIDLMNTEYFAAKYDKEGEKKNETRQPAQEPKQEPQQ